MSLRLSTGLRNALAAKYAIAHAALIGSNGAFVDGGGGNDIITDSGNSLVTAGFQIGDWIKVFGATTGANNITAKLLAVAAGAMEIGTGIINTAEAFAAGTIVVAAKGGSLNDLMKHGIIRIYSGTQPASPDETESGTLLVTITDNGGAHNTGTGENGLEFEDAAIAGTLGKLAAQTWKGTPGNTGQAGWFRFYDQSVVTGASSSGVRFDGSCALGSGGQLNLASLTITTGVDFVINTFDMIVPVS